MVAQLEREECRLDSNWVIKHKEENKGQGSYTFEYNLL